MLLNIKVISTIKAIELSYLLEIRWCMWFKSAEKGFLPLIILKINSLNISKPGIAKKMKISSGLKAKFSLYDLIKIYEIINANDCVPLSPR